MLTCWSRLCWMDTSHHKVAILLFHGGDLVRLNVNCGAAELPYEWSMISWIWFSFYAMIFKYTCIYPKVKFFTLFKKHTNMVTKAYHIFKKHTTWSCGMPLHPTWHTPKEYYVVCQHPLHKVHNAMFYRLVPWHYDVGPTLAMYVVCSIDWICRNIGLIFSRKSFLFSDIIYDSNKPNLALTSAVNYKMCSCISVIYKGLQRHILAHIQSVCLCLYSFCVYVPEQGMHVLISYIYMAWYVCLPVYTWDIAIFYSVYAHIQGIYVYMPIYSIC